MANAQNDIDYIFLGLLYKSSKMLMVIEIGFNTLLMCRICFFPSFLLAKKEDTCPPPEEKGELVYRTGRPVCRTGRLVYRTGEPGFKGRS